MRWIADAPVQPLSHVRLTFELELSMVQGVMQARERLMDGVPVSERRVDLAGISTPVVEGGEGTPIVLLHGPGEHALKWVPVLSGLVTRNRVIAPDLPGHGESVVTGGDLSAELVVRWLGELLESVAGSPAIVVGQVVGGAVAMRLAAENDRHIARLVLVDTLGLAPFAPAPTFGAALGAFLASPDERTYKELWRYCAYDAESLSTRLGDWWEVNLAYSLDRVRSPEGGAALHRIMELFGLPAIPDDVLRRIRVPTSLIWGRHDLATDLGVAEAASARYGWPLHVVEGAADDPTLEQPERFLEALRAAQHDR